MNDFDKGFMMGMAVGGDDDPPPRGFFKIYSNFIFIKQ